MPLLRHFGSSDGSAYSADFGDFLQTAYKSCTHTGLAQVPVAGYDLSFVITSQHVQEYNRAGLVDACCNFLQESIAATEMKLLVSARGRAVASSFLGSLR